MICGALQTLNEEACEDVMEELGEAGEFSRSKKGEKIIKNTNYGQPYGEAPSARTSVYCKDSEIEVHSVSDPSLGVFDQNLEYGGSISSSFDSAMSMRYSLNFDPKALYWGQYAPNQYPSTSGRQDGPKEDNVADAETQTTPSKTRVYSSYLEEENKPKSPPDKGSQAGRKGTRDSHHPSSVQPKNPKKDKNNDDSSSHEKNANGENDSLEFFETVINNHSTKKNQNKHKSPYTLSFDP